MLYFGLCLLGRGYITKRFTIDFLIKNACPLLACSEFGYITLRNTNSIERFERLIVTGKLEAKRSRGRSPKRKADQVLECRCSRHFIMPPTTLNGEPLSTGLWKIVTIVYNERLIMEETSGSSELYKKRQCFWRKQSYLTIIPVNTAEKYK